MQGCSTTPRLIVIGNGMVGQRFLETLVVEAAGRFALEVLCEESRLAYDRVRLTSFLNGEGSAGLELTNSDFF